MASEQAAGWADATDGDFVLRTLPGDHFDLVPQQAQAVADVLHGLNMPVA